MSSRRPWSHYQEGRVRQTSSPSVGNTEPAAQGLNDTIDPTLVDNGVGRAVGLPDASRSLTLADVSGHWRFKRFAPLQLASAAATRATGQLATVTVSARNATATPDAGRAVRYAITGANPGCGCGDDGRRRDRRDHVGRRQRSAPTR